MKAPSNRENRDSIFWKAARFIACEKIEGDYFEFGVYQGVTFANNYHIFKANFEARIRQDIGGQDRAEHAQQRQTIWDNMRFFAFDSYEGLPELSCEDAESDDFTAGQYACNLETVKQNLLDKNVPIERFVPVKGFFEDTCNPTTIQQYQIKKAALVFIDCDIYSATATVLDFILPFLQDGTVLVFDDWFSYRANPNRGQQRAFYEWSESDKVSQAYSFTEYQKDKWKRNSFIVNAKN